MYAQIYFCCGQRARWCLVLAGWLAPVLASFPGHFLMGTFCVLRIALFSCLPGILKDKEAFNANAKICSPRGVCWPVFTSHETRHTPLLTPEAQKVNLTAIFYIFNLLNFYHTLPHKLKQTKIFKNSQNIRLKHL